MTDTPTASKGAVSRVATIIRDLHRQSLYTLIERFGIRGARRGPESTTSDFVDLAAKLGAA